MIRQWLIIENKTDEDGNPAGGCVEGVGLDIEWQNGPLGRGEDRGEPNGTFVETVLHACRQRLLFYQESKFKCVENELAIHHLTLAIDILEERTRSREERKVEGTHAL